MSFDIMLSLCIPTNGIVEWVFPVLDSIYNEEMPVDTFEVIVTDNGNNLEFKRKMYEYASKHINLVYKETNAVQFTNQIEAFRLAKGKMIKFVNHRMRLLPGALNYLISYAKNNYKEKPVTYFANGMLQDGAYTSFDEYVNNLSYYSSWSAGTSMWRDDFNRMDLSKPFNKLFPHIDMIFSEKKKKAYIIDNHILMKGADITDEKKKGHYDIFYAFAVEYPSIILELYKENTISYSTFYKIKCDTLNYLAELYLQYVIRKKPCSYDLSGYSKAINVFYRHTDVIKSLPKQIVTRMSKKINRNFF